MDPIVDTDTTYRDRSGLPVGLQEWAGLVTDDFYAQVAHGLRADGALVATMWTGRGPSPFQVSTTVGPVSVSTRYATEEDALTAHEQALAGTLAEHLR